MRGLVLIVARMSRQSQDRSRANARAASTELSQARVEREEVELFLAGHASRRRVSRTA